MRSFLFCGAALCSMRDLSSSTRDRTRTPCIGSRVNHWTTRDVIPLTRASAFTFLILICQHRAVLHPQEGSGCGWCSRDICAFLRLFYRVNLIQGIAVVSNEGPRRQKRNAEATAIGRKGCRDGVSVLWGGDNPPPPLLLDPPGLREVALRPTSVTWAIYQTLSVPQFVPPQNGLISMSACMRSSEGLNEFNSSTVLHKALVTPVHGD